MTKSINQSRQEKERRAYFIGKFSFRVCPLNPELVKRYNYRCWVENYLAKNSVIIKFEDGYRTCTGKENIKLIGFETKLATGSASAKQTMFIVNLCMRKSLQCPATISSWSSKFASKYISYLISLPDSAEPQRFTPPAEQAELNRFWSESDMLFNSQRRIQRGEYFSDGLDDIPITKQLSAEFHREQEEVQ